MFDKLTDVTPFSSQDIPRSLRAYLSSDLALDFPPQGMTSDVAFATGTCRAAVVKRCTDPVYRHWLQREQLVLRALADCNLPVPAPIAYEEVAYADGFEGWLLMSRLEGEPLESVLLRTPVSRRAGLLFRLGELLRRLHATPIPATLQREQDWASRKLHEAQANLTWCDGTAALLAQLRDSKPAPVPARLIHGDLALDNVLVDTAGNMSLIDWSQGDAGDFRCDVALALRSEPADELELNACEIDAFYRGYGYPQLDADTCRWFELLYEFF